MEKFIELGLSKGITDVLKQFAFKKPSEIQEKAIPLALAGKDIIGGSATGSGKTLVFASAIIENLKPNREVQALVLLPTRELAEQVADSIRNFGKNKRLNVLPVYGGVGIESQIRRIPSTDILVGTPGRIIDHLNRKTLRLNKVKFLVLDEVDRMFDMGFRRDVEKIIQECPKERQTMMFSATVSQDIDYLSKKYTKNPVGISVTSYVDPSKLKQVYYDVQDNKKFSLLVHLLKQEKTNFVLVFCNTRRNVDFITDNLISNGIKAKAIHGGFEQKKRLRILDEFKKEGVGVLVCTDVAARGLDIKDVSHVYNYDFPADLKDYIHRIGRTAREGKDGKAVTILASRDYEKFGSLMQSKEIQISPEKLTDFEIVRINVNSGKSNNRFNRGQREHRGDFRNSIGRNDGSRNYSRNTQGRSREQGQRSFGRGDFNRGRSNSPRGNRVGNNQQNRDFSRGRSSIPRSRDFGRGARRNGRDDKPRTRNFSRSVRRNNSKSFSRYQR